MPRPCICFRRVFRPPVVRFFFIVFALTFLSALLAFLYLSDARHLACFFHHDEKIAREYMKRDNSARLRSAEQYFDMLDQTKLHSMLSHEDSLTNGTAVVAITVVTVSRNRRPGDDYETKYLTQVVWQLLALLYAARGRGGFPYDVRFAICNVDRDPATYEEARRLARFIPSFQRFDKTHFSLVHPLEKEKQDYVYCLKQSMTSSGVDPAYVMLVEDDALPMEDFFPVLARTLFHHVERHWQSGDVVPRMKAENVAYIKFYHPDRLLGFLGFDRERVTDLVGLVALLGTALTLVYGVACDTTGMHTVWALSCVYCLVLVLGIGRANINELRRLATPLLHTYTPAPSCCTPALLFPRAGAARVVEFLAGVRCDAHYGKDSALDDLLRKGDMRAYLVQPNTFRHIGQYSVLRERLVDACVVD